MILRWVHKHGLLRLEDPNADRLSLQNQAPITPEEFREEARRAYDALTLFEAIRSKNWASLRPRINRMRVAPSSSLAVVYLDGRPVPVMKEADSELSGEDVWVVAVNALEHFVSENLKGINLDFDHVSGHPHPQEVYRPRLVVSIPDLHSAIWYQFARLMADTRPVKYCVVCDQPIPRPRKNRETCSDACRQRKKRQADSVDDD
jgi:hypothetical protein